VPKATTPFRIFTSNSMVTLRPRLACEILPEGVVAARQDSATEESAITTFAPVPAGSIVAGLKTPNLFNRAAVVAAMRSALDELSPRDKKITLVVPDAAVRVLLLDFDTLPPKAADILPVLRFRLRKLVPFEVDEAGISYQELGTQLSGQVRVLIAIIPHDVLTEYESAVRDAGYEPGAILSSSLAAIAASRTEDPMLILNRNGNTITTAIAQPNDLLLHRTLELPANEAEITSELQRTVNVAMAYFEDTLRIRPTILFYAGPGGAAAVEPLLAEIDLQVRDLVPAPTAGATSAMRKGLLSGVVGALAN
jgi:type IV pilus assembly protein PilM